MWLHVVEPDARADAPGRGPRPQAEAVPASVRRVRRRVQEQRRPRFSPQASLSRSA